MRVITFSRVDYKPVVEVLLLEPVAVAPGAGSAAKNSAESISILKRVNVVQQEGTITTPNVVGGKPTLKCRTIALADIIVIAADAGHEIGADQWLMK